MAHNVFISYAKDDQRVADAVCEALEKGGIRCWYAPRDVPYLVDYEEAIIDAISQSELMLLILSEHANASSHVKREVQNACREEPQIPVLPFQITDVPLSKSFRYYIGSVQWLVASTPPLEAHLQKLVSYVQQRLLQSEQDTDAGTQSSQLVQPEIAGHIEEEALRHAEEALRLAAEEERQRREAEEKRRAEEEERQRQEAEAQRLKAEEEEERARLEKLWDEVGEEMERERRLAEEKRERAALPTTERAKIDLGELPLRGLKALPPEKVVLGDSAEPHVVVMRKPFYRRMGSFAISFVIAMSAFIALLYWTTENSGEQTAANNSQTSTDSSTSPLQTNPDTKTASTPPADTVVRNSLGMEFVYVPAGSFMMGSDSGDSKTVPVHQVTIPNGFYMGRYEVTQAQWKAVMRTTVEQQRDKSDQSTFLNGVGKDYPMYFINWEDTQAFIKSLNARNDGYAYRLPSEAEWEYACRAGTTGDYAGEPYAMAWYSGNSGQQSNPVGRKQPNNFGLYDMNGNLWEWCQDVFRRNYDGAPGDGSAWLGEVEYQDRVLRGGSFIDDHTRMRSVERNSYSHTIRSPMSGFRLVAVPRPIISPVQRPTPIPNKNKVGRGVGSGIE